MKKILLTLLALFVSAGVALAGNAPTTSIGGGTAASLHVDDIITLSGMPEGSQHLGVFSGTTINDNVTVKAAIQALETAVEGKAAVNASTTGSAGSLKSNATTGAMQVVGPAAGTIRVMTTPDANFTALYKSGAYPDGAMLGADGTAGAVKSLGVPITMTSDTTGPKYYDTTADTWESGSYALTPVIDDPDNFAANFTGANLYGGTFIANAAGTAALPEPAAGMNFTYVLEGANANIIDPLGTGTADTIVMNGLAAAADENITSSTSGAMCVFQYRAANSWMATCNGFVEATPP